MYGPVGRLACWAITLLAACFAWVLFRAPDVGTAWGIYKGMVGANGLSLPVSLQPQLAAWHLPSWVYFNDLFQGATLPATYSFGKLMMKLAIASGIAFFAPSVASIYEIGKGLTVPWQRRIFARPAALALGTVLTFGVFSISKVSPFLYFQF